MPYLPVKIKEVFMSLREELLELDTAVRNFSQGVNALQVMSLGLFQALDPYADGFSALLSYMLDADREVRKYMDNCLKAI